MHGQQNIKKGRSEDFNALNAELNPICHPLALLGAHHILHVSRVRVKVFCNIMLSRLQVSRIRYSVNRLTAD